MSAVSVSESGVRPILADAVDLARRALLELEPAGVGAHLGVAAEDDSAATHHFEATLPGYRGWQWAVVVAAPPEADYATVSESALLPGPDALVAPDFVPWDQRIRPGDLAPGDLLAPPPNDPRLVPGYVANGDPAVDEVATEIGLGRTQVMSLEGREMAAERWYAEFGPDTEMAKAAPSTCGLCGFYLPLAGSLRAAFGVCGNAMGADGHVVHAAYGCGAHSDTVAPTGGGSPLYEAFDDAAVELIPAEELAPVKEPPAAEATATEAADPVGEPAAGEATATKAGGPAVETVAGEAVATETADPVVETVAAEAVATEATGPAMEAAAGEAVATEAADPVEEPAAGEATAAEASGSAVEAAAAEADAAATHVTDPVATSAVDADAAAAAQVNDPAATPAVDAGAAAVAQVGDGAAETSATEGEAAAAPDAVAPVVETPDVSVASAADTASEDGAAVAESTPTGEAPSAGVESASAEIGSAEAPVVESAPDAETSVATADAEAAVDNSGEAAAQADEAEVAQASLGDEQVADGAAEAAEGGAVESSPQN
ncbi:DUF3027 domain-containing protein [Nocardia sp. NPDC052316]|uniref:DUF3027 domain-containing protein n=1 Tax=Nocardia sp. NPDC052316 TaxID=3364329 RepID=UPI0037CA054F